MSVGLPFPSAGSRLCSQVSSRVFLVERKIGAKEEIMEKVKLGIIGIGNMGSVHLGNIVVLGLVGVLEPRQDDVPRVPFQVVA